MFNCHNMYVTEEKTLNFYDNIIFPLDKKEIILMKVLLIFIDFKLHLLTGKREKIDGCID